MNARENLRAELRKSEKFFGVKSQEYYDKLVDSWMDDKKNSKHRFDTFKVFLPKAKKILDLASGCGTFVFYGLLNGFDVFGIDPSHWKYKFNEMKAREYSYPSEWINKFIIGYGENIPFEDNFFDCVSTYQTLEHVQNLNQVLKEMIRVTKSGGGIHIKCPDYKGTFEGHYLVPWFPLFPKRFARTYLRILKKPIYGLATLQYTTRNDIIRRLHRICNQKSSWKAKIIDVKRIKVEKALIKKKIPRLGGLSYLLFLLFEYLGFLFRKEISIDLFICINKK